MSLSLDSEPKIYNHRHLKTQVLNSTYTYVCKTHWYDTAQKQHHTLAIYLQAMHECVQVIRVNVGNACSSRLSVQK